MNYAHLSREQRYQIQALRRQDLSCARLVACLGLGFQTASSNNCLTDRMSVMTVCGELPGICEHVNAPIIASPRHDSLTGGR